MKTYIVFDLEWNQSPNGKERSDDNCPFEIMEIGAIKLDGQWNVVDEFHRLIRPQIYPKLHYMISEVTHMDMEELNARGVDFITAMEAFTAWCGTDAIYCTWGSQDLTELQRNLVYYGMENPFPKPLCFYDVQKLFGLLDEEGRRLSLDGAVAELQLPQNRPFHRALDDAYYTGFVLKSLDKDQIQPYLSVDYFRLPESKEEHIRMVFPSYSKEVSRVFPTKEDALADKGILEMKCYVCNRALRKKIRWFAANQRMWYGLAICPEHGYLKGKIRIKKVDDTHIFAVKTLKLTDEDGAQGIRDRKTGVQQRRAQRNRAKKQRKS
ncbi:MAG: exonuclease domain-containing protein [Lachnospiraceae bacterium]